MLSARTGNRIQINTMASYLFTINIFERDHNVNCTRIDSSGDCCPTIRRYGHGSDRIFSDILMFTASRILYYSTGPRSRLVMLQCLVVDNDK